MDLSQIVPSDKNVSFKDQSIIVLADWLKVRGTLKGWTKLWCILKPGLLLLYRSPKAKVSNFLYLFSRVIGLDHASPFFFWQWWINRRTEMWESFTFERKEIAKRNTKQKESLGYLLSQKWIVNFFHTNFQFTYQILPREHFVNS